MCFKLYAFLSNKLLTLKIETLFKTSFSSREDCIVWLILY